MLKIENVLVSDDLKNNYFACHLKACSGDCCVEGDAGAPLEEEEISVLEDYIDEVKPFMSDQGKEVIEKNGVFDYDADGDYVTPLVNHRECAFVYKENNINFCAIEKAFLDGKIKFQKPVSCHLYPVRLSKVGEFTAVNYHKWNICAPAIIKGRQEGIPLYVYLKTSFIRKFGAEWYNKFVNEINSAV